MKLSNRLKIELKTAQEERRFLPIERVKICVEKFAIQYRKDGKDWIDRDLFLVNAKQSITNILIDRRQNKVKFILSCMMEKVDLKDGEVIVKEAAFHSKTEVNLESTDSNELFSKMKETVLKTLAKFQRQGSNYLKIPFCLESGSSHGKVCATWRFLLYSLRVF